MSVYRGLAELVHQNGSGVLCIVVRSHGSTPRHAGSKMLVYPDGKIIGSVGGGELESRVLAEARIALADGKSRLLVYNLTDPERGDPGVCGGQVEVFVDPIIPRPVLVVVGGGHVGRAVVHLANWMGFRVVVSDDRPEFCTPQAVPGADAYYPLPLSALPDQLEITPWTYIVLTTRGVPVDVEGLPALLDSPAAYIGVIGSRRRWETTRDLLIKAGISPERLDSVHSPVGLNIQAETPEEIAISILAQVIEWRNSGH